MNKHLALALFGLFIIALSGTIIFFLSGTNRVAIVETTITDVDVALHEIVLTGELAIENPSRINIDVTAVTYDVSLRTGNALASGEMEPFRLKRQTVTRVPFTITADTTQIDDVLLELVKEDTVYVDLDGVVTVKAAGFLEYDIPFSQSYDIKEKLLALIPENARGLVDAALGFVSGFLS
ncbi:MAG: LEA type 2 family protein [Candidatus Woesearchaeota archaeon]|nr:LEA type 2 family protein [Candidatus Woesearchaeota archaeon]